MPIELSAPLQHRLEAVRLSPSTVFAGGRTAWEAWLVLRERWGERATLVDLYELDAAARGMAPEQLSAEDRLRIKAQARPILYPDRDPVLPGSDRHGDPHEIHEYDPSWATAFEQWRARIAAALGPVARSIHHVGSTSVPGLAAKPIIDIMICVPDVEEEEEAYLGPLRATGVILRAREEGHRFLWPPRDRPRDVHVHVCEEGGEFARDELLFRDHLRAHPDVRDSYADLKRDLIVRWAEDRKAYTEAKTAFVLDALDEARRWVAG